MKLTSILTGDIIDSRKHHPQDWSDALRNLFERKGDYPTSWEIYRGDEFQLEIENPADALLTALEVRALLRSLQLDARISIGIGTKDFTADRIAESNGSAFVRSGESLERLKSQKAALSVTTGHDGFDDTINLMLRLAEPIVGTWLPQQAAYALEAIQNPALSQEEIGQRLDINQAAVSGRRKRSHFELLTELDAYFRKHIQNLKP